MNVSRRDFLNASIAAASIASSGNLLFAAPQKESKPNLKLGLVTYNWGKNWDVPTILKNCTATGFTGVELRSTHKHGVEITLSQAERKNVRELFADSDIELVGLGSACEYHSTDQRVVAKNIEETRQFVRLCHDVGGSGVKVRPNGLPADVPIEKTLEQIGRSLNLVGRFGEEFGVQIRVEVHGRGTSEIPHMKSIMEIADHPNVVVCWNCNAADLDGAGFEKNFASLEERMGTVHIHDLRNDNYPWKPLFANLSEVKAPGFTGWTLLEDGRVPEDIVAAMKENRKIWDELVGSRT